MKTIKRFKVNGLIDVHIDGVIEFEGNTTESAKIFVEESLCLLRIIKTCLIAQLPLL